MVPNGEDWHRLVYACRGRFNNTTIVRKYVNYPVLEGAICGASYAQGKGFNNKYNPRTMVTPDGTTCTQVVLNYEHMEELAHRCVNKVMVRPVENIQELFFAKRC